MDIKKKNEGKTIETREKKILSLRESKEQLQKIDAQKKEIEENVI